MNNNSIPLNLKIYHIVHLDRLSSIVDQNGLWSDAKVQQRQLTGPLIGMKHIKSRRLRTALKSHANLNIGDCVPFYFCPRSVMLYILFRNNHEEIAYRGGQEPIVHLQSDLSQTIAWAKAHSKRWAFTDSNAGSSYFNDYTGLSNLQKINWQAVQSLDWKSCREHKQAEFLIEAMFPWELVEKIGVFSITQLQQVSIILNESTYQPDVSVQTDWYY